MNCFDHWRLKYTQVQCSHLAFKQSPSGVRAVRTILKFLPAIIFRNSNLSISFFFFILLFGRQCYWLGGERMVDPVWERYAGRRKGLINGAFFRINVSYIKKIERDSSIWYILDKAFCLILEYIFGSVFYEFARNWGVFTFLFHFDSISR